MLTVSRSILLSGLVAPWPYSSSVPGVTVPVSPMSATWTSSRTWPWPWLQRAGDYSSTTSRIITRFPNSLRLLYRANTEAIQEQITRYFILHFAIILFLCYFYCDIPQDDIREIDCEYTPPGRLLVRIKSLPTMFLSIRSCESVTRSCMMASQQGPSDRLASAAEEHDQQGQQ